MPRSLFSVRPRRKTFVDQYLDERFDYGGELWSRVDIIRDLKRQDSTTVA